MMGICIAKHDTTENLAGSISLHLSENNNMLVLNIDGNDDIAFNEYEEGINFPEEYAFHSGKHKTTMITNTTITAG